ncbi:hypothetical protein BH23BAC1_BH23BAC1_08250 [soil metagenome]
MKSNIQINWQRVKLFINVDVGNQLIKDYLFYGDANELKEIKSGEGKTIKLNGERLAAYRDEKNSLHIVSSICTHMGCIVHWNNGEKSWDCPATAAGFRLMGKCWHIKTWPNLKILRKVINVNQEKFFQPDPLDFFPEFEILFFLQFNCIRPMIT